jgi:hypothetical protein
MIALENKTHRQMLDRGYILEQVVPLNGPDMFEEFDLDSAGYDQVRIIPSSSAFRSTRFSPTSKASCVYVKLSREEKEARIGLHHELIVNVKDRKTGETIYLDLAA